MNEKNGRLVFLWSSADSRSTLGADSQAISFIFSLFQFCFGCPVSYLVSEQTPIYLNFEAQSIHNKKNHQKKKKNPMQSLFPNHRNTSHYSKPDFPAKQKITTVANLQNHCQIRCQQRIPFAPATHYEHLPSLPCACSLSLISKVTQYSPLCVIHFLQPNK